MFWVVALDCNILNVSSCRSINYSLFHRLTVNSGIIWKQVSHYTPISKHTANTGMTGHPQKRVYSDGHKVFPTHALSIYSVGSYHGPGLARVGLFTEGPELSKTNPVPALRRFSGHSTESSVNDHTINSLKSPLNYWSILFSCLCN